MVNFKYLVTFVEKKKFLEVLVYKKNIEQFTKYRKLLFFSFSRNVYYMFKINIYNWIAKKES